MTADRDVDRTTVKTYVPAYQKREWKDHADELGMSQSEFVRTMVQAGRRGFEPPETDASAERSDTADEPAPTPEIDGEPASADTRSRDANPRGSTPETGSRESPESGGMKDRIVSVLEREDVLSWDDLLEQVTDDIERRLDDAVQELQSENRVRYSGREGGYTLADRS